MVKLALLSGKPVFSKTHTWPRWPEADTQDEKRVLEVVRSGAWGIGCPVTAEFAAEFAGHLAMKHVLPVGTGTAALELIVKALGLGPGDEVIVPGYTFIASATCVLELGATVVFADIDPATFNIDPRHVRRLLTPRTRAIIAVHFAGNPADLAALKAVVRGRDIAIIEDAAHAHGMLYRGKCAGHHGAAAAFSFQSSKNMASGEGGAVATNSKKLYELCWSFHSFGRLPKREWYEHFNMSWNHRMAGFQAAILLGQLRRLAAQSRTRFDNGAFLNRALAQIPGLTPQADGDRDPRTRRAYHLYMMRYDARATGLSRDLFLKALTAEGVPCSAGYVQPLPQSPMFTENRYWHHQFAGKKIDGIKEPDYCRVQLPECSRMCREAVWLTQSMLLAPRRDMQGIVDAMAKVLANAETLRSHPAG
jgi:dTDP-4-amino-4,6-dideoxygalactose transaminase